jgi:uncharacterized protein involved in exopolysaccharide biosynthesis
LEEQRSQAKIELDTAYSLLERFQRSNKAISISEQMRAQMETMSGLKAQIIAQQINLDMLLRDRLPTDLQVAESRNYLNELKNKYNEFQKGKGSDKYILGFEEVPALTREYATFFREVKIKEEVYSLINQLYYREKIQGFRDTPTVVVLDEPRVPALRSSPKRFISLIAIIALSLFLAVLTVIFRQSYLRSKQDEKTSMLWLLFNQSIKSLFKSVTVKSK